MTGRFIAAIFFVLGTLMIWGVFAGDIKSDNNGVHADQSIAFVLGLGLFAVTGIIAAIHSAATRIVKAIEKAAADTVEDTQEVRP